MSHLINIGNVKNQPKATKSEGEKENNAASLVTSQTISLDSTASIPPNGVNQPFNFTTHCLRYPPRAYNAE